MARAGRDAGERCRSRIVEGMGSLETRAGAMPVVDLHPPEALAEGVEVTFLMPCLNEAGTIERCVQAAAECIRENRLNAEILVADNGSTDGSQDLARRAGARVVQVAEKGYGNALRGGIDAARGRYVIMGDSDLSYDFGEGMKFVERLREGHDLVMGTRFGPGSVEPGAMPFLHRWLGNPMISLAGRALFGSPFRDFYCGLRGFSKDAYRRLDLRTTGMEFAIEMVAKASLRGMRLAQVPITLHKDGRGRAPHLRTWRDGWRTLRFMLCISPRWALLIPGLILMALGLVSGTAIYFGTVRIGGVGFDVNTLIASSLAVLVGYMWVTCAVGMRVFALSEDLGPPSPGLNRLLAVFTLERGLIAGALLILAGLAFIGALLRRWSAVDFGNLDLSTATRTMTVGATLVAMGFQTVLMSFMYSMLNIPRRGK